MATRALAQLNKVWDVLYERDAAHRQRPHHLNTLPNAVHPSVFSERFPYRPCPTCLLYAGAVTQWIEKYNAHTA